MVHTWKTRVLLLAAIEISMMLLTLASGSAQLSGPTYSYNMTFNRDGLTTVDILYNSGLSGPGSSWVAVPKTPTQTTATPMNGNITSTARIPYSIDGGRSVHAFYDNLTFSYDSRDAPFSMHILFNMTYGAMIVEPNGFFYSPQIGVSPSARAQAKLILPDGVVALKDAAPTPAQVGKVGAHYELFFNPASESRLAVTFTVSWPTQTQHIQEGIVGADVPPRYLDLGKRMVSLYRNAVPLMDSLFNETVDRISLEFFTPLSLPDLGIGGYTPIDPSSFQVGTIHLNLFYFRALSGTMETIAIHELTHQYEARAGISPGLLWVHEGMANYVAVSMSGSLGYSIASTDAELEAAASRLNGDYGMVQYWQPGATVASLYEYYAASYVVFRSLGDAYGGLALYSIFFQELHDLEGGLKSTNAAVLRLGRAAETNLFPQFRKWGFELVDISSLAAQIAKLRAEAEWYGPLLPFRKRAFNHLELAQSSLDNAPEAATGHIKIAAFYIEAIPRIIGGFVLIVILSSTVAIVFVSQNRKERVTFSYQSTH